jgi:ubiquinone/menaquinone biosynthesis C-methylase UbiE
MKTYNTGAQCYFDRVPREWDTFYSHENKLMYLLNRYLRQGLYMRHQLTFENCGDLTDATVLDIGCGTGRYSIECAKRGARKVVGIDFAPQMIEFSKNIAAQMGVEDTCEFICGDFMSHPFHDSFDVVLALGLFDYIQDPKLMFEKIASLRPKKFIASFPRFTPIWGLQRYIRYNLIRKCPIYYYNKPHLQSLYQSASINNYELIPCGKGFVGVGRTG